MHLYIFAPRTLKERLAAVIPSWRKMGSKLNETHLKQNLTNLSTSVDQREEDKSVEKSVKKIKG